MSSGLKISQSKYLTETKVTSLFYGSTYFENFIQGICLDNNFLWPQDVAGQLVDKQVHDYNL